MGLIRTSIQNVSLVLTWQALLAIKIPNVQHWMQAHRRAVVVSLNDSLQRERQEENRLPLLQTQFRMIP
jgi:hypothetical protein